MPTTATTGTSTTMMPMPTRTPCESATIALANNRNCASAQARLQATISGGSVLADSDINTVCAQTCRTLITNSINQCTDDAVSYSAIVYKMPMQYSILQYVLCSYSTQLWLQLFGSPKFDIVIDFSESSPKIW